jgi:hypothetical protein
LGSLVPSAQQPPVKHANAEKQILLSKGSKIDKFRLARSARQQEPQFPRFGIACPERTTNAVKHANAEQENVKNRQISAGALRSPAETSISKIWDRWSRARKNPASQTRMRSRKTSKIDKCRLACSARQQKPQFPRFEIGCPERPTNRRHKREGGVAETRQNGEYVNFRRHSHRNELTNLKIPAGEWNELATNRQKSEDLQR